MGYFFSLMLLVLRYMPINCFQTFKRRPMKNPLFVLITPTLLIAAALSSGVASAADAGKETYERAVAAAKTEHKIAKAKCDELAGDRKDICSVTARGAFDIAKAEAKEQYKATAKNRNKTAMVRAEAAYEIAKAQCQTSSGHTKAVCEKEAKAAHVKAKSEAESTLMHAEKDQDLRKETAKLQEETNEAAYKVAEEKCDGFSGETKETCLEKAKAIRR